MSPGMPQGKWKLGLACAAVGYSLISGCGDVEAPAATRVVRAAHKGAQKPNVLLVVVDTLRYDASSAGGRGDAASPHLAALARNGVSFRNAYSTWDETTISHWSLLTGYATGFESDLNSASYSLAHQLKAAGYYTFGTAANLQLSKKATPVVQPFDDYVCLGDEWEAMPRAQKNVLMPGIDARIRAYGGRLTDFNRLMTYVKGDGVLVSVATQLHRRRNAPFFGFVNIVEPHDPYFPDPSRYDVKAEERGLARPSAFDGDLRNRPIPPELEHPDTIVNPQRRTVIASTLERVGNRAWSTTFDLTPAALAIYRHRYEANVRQADAVVGGLLRLLRDEGLLSSTVVIVTSDHGEAFGESALITHAFGNKGDFEATHHVPLVWSFPASFGFVPHASNDVVSLADVAPTIYDLAGLDWTPLAKEAAVPGTYGKSLMVYLGKSEQALPTARTSSAPREPASDRKAVNAERERRLRSLGYIH